MKTCINNKIHRLTLERMVIGLEEPILIKGVGELLAKIDSGNGGYNVIHGEDFVVQGDILNFKTVNKDGDERRVSKKIKETLRVNIGGGHIQERPVVELNVKFGGEDYKKVPFSVTNRSDNEHKVLISKDFVGKELEALIDVTKDNIANDNIEVDYVTEGFLDTAKNTIATIATGTEGQQKWADKMTSLRSAMQGNRVNPFGVDKEKNTLSEEDKKVEEEVKELSNIGQLIKNDEVLIENQLKTQEGKFPADFNAQVFREVQSTDANGQPVTNVESQVKVQKLLDYMGNTNVGSATSNPSYHQRMKDVLAAYKKYKEESEEVIVSEAATPPQQPANKQKNKQVNDPTKEIQGVQAEKEVGSLNKEEVNKELQNLQKRNRTIFYLVSFASDANGNPLTTGPDLTKGIQNIIDSWSTKLVQEERWNKNSFIPFVAQLVRSIDKNAKGLFAICSEPMENRKVEFFTNPGLFYNNEESAETTKITDEIVQEYQQLNSLYKELGGIGDISIDGIQTLLQQPTEVQPANSMETLVQEYKQLNDEFLRIADDLAGEGTSINLDDLQALITLGGESSQNKRSNELGQTDAGDSHDSSIQSYDMMR